MGVAKTVRTAVVGVNKQRTKQLLPIVKWYCQCITESGEEIYIAVKTRTEAEASEKAHDGYNIDYVLDILTPLQMEYRKRHLRKAIAAGIAHYA